MHHRRIRVDEGDKPASLLTVRRGVVPISAPTRRRRGKSKSGPGTVRKIVQAGTMTGQTDQNGMALRAQLLDNLMGAITRCMALGGPLRLFERLSAAYADLQLDEMTPADAKQAAAEYQARAFRADRVACLDRGASVSAD